MPKSVNQKQKLLFLLDYLRQNTDETHTVTTPQIIDHLAANGIRAERKSIYNDIQTLCDYGYDIIRTEGAHAGYRIADRTFELPEVKLLVEPGTVFQIYYHKEITAADWQTGTACQ